MKTTTETLKYPQTSSSQKLLDIVQAKILGQKKDYFLPYKYEMIKQYYGQKCLDIGAGNGSYSEYLRGQQHRVTSLDVVDKSNPDVGQNIQLFNGKDIPFLDKTFDTSLLMFVLHHTNMQNQLIKDCIRVTRKHIIIAEDIIRNRFDAVLGAIHLHSSPWDRGNDSFKTHEQWKHFFDTHKLELVETVNISRWIYPVYPVTRKIYVLKVNN